MQAAISLQQWRSLRTSRPCRTPFRTSCAPLFAALFHVMCLSITARVCLHPRACPTREACSECLSAELACSRSGRPWIEAANQLLSATDIPVRLLQVHLCPEDEAIEALGTVAQALTSAQVPTNPGRCSVLLIVNASGHPRVSQAARVTKVPGVKAEPAVPNIGMGGVPAQSARRHDDGWELLYFRA